MSMFDSGLPSITVLCDVPFPATLISGPGIQVLTADPTAWEMSLDYDPLPEDDLALAPLSNYYLAVEDANQTPPLYNKVRLDHFGNQVLSIDQRTPIGDTSYTVQISDRYVGLTAPLTVNRIITLPPAATVAAGRQLTLQDECGGLSGTGFWTVMPAGTDLIDGKNVFYMARAYGGVRLTCDGASRWSISAPTGMRVLTAVSSYNSLPDDTTVGISVIPGPNVRVVLPPCGTVFPGKTITVLDLGGQCSTVSTITAAPAGTDLINGLPAPLQATLNTPYSYITLQSDGVSRWTIVAGGTNPSSETITSSQISDATTTGRNVLTAASPVAAQQAIGATAVGSNLFSAVNSTAALGTLGGTLVGQAVFTAASPAAAQSALGLGTMATQNGNNVNVTGGAIASTQLNNDTIVGGTIDNTPIGNTTPANGTFAQLMTTQANITGGNINGTTIGASVRAAGSFSTLQATNLDNTVIGANTPAAASVTSLNGGPLAGLRNRIVNGDFHVDQRAFASTGGGVLAGGYFTDRWNYTASQASKFSCSTASGTLGTLGGGGWVSFVVASAATLAAADNFACSQIIEGLNCIDLAWGTSSAKPVTLSFAFYSSLTGTHSGSLCNLGGTRSYSFTWSNPVANTWTPVHITIPGDTAGTWHIDNTAGIYLRFNLGSGSTFLGPAGAWSGSNFVGATGAVQPVVTASATFAFGNVQLEAGSIATPFERRPIGLELSLCQRYYQRYTSPSAGAIQIQCGYASGVATQTNLLTFSPMRIAPTPATIGTWVTSNASGGGFTLPTPNSVILYATSAAAGPFSYAAPANGGFDLSAEL